MPQGEFRRVIYFRVPPTILQPPSFHFSTVKEGWPLSLRSMCAAQRENASKWLRASSPADSTPISGGCEGPTAAPLGVLRVRTPMSVDLHGRCGVGGLFHSVLMQGEHCHLTLPVAITTDVQCTKLPSQGTRVSLPVCLISDLGCSCNHFQSPCCGIECQSMGQRGAAVIQPR